jgi:hypothetical protein
LRHRQWNDSISFCSKPLKLDVTISYPHFLPHYLSRSRLSDGFVLSMDITWPSKAILMPARTRLMSIFTYIQSMNEIHWVNWLEEHAPHKADMIHLLSRSGYEYSTISTLLPQIILWTAPCNMSNVYSPNIEWLLWNVLLFH